MSEPRPGDRADLTDRAELTDRADLIGALLPDIASVLSAAPLPMVVTTADARVLDANQAMQRLVGVPLDGLTGRFLAELAGPPHGRVRRLASVAAAAAHPVTSELSFSLGRRRTVTVRVVVARGAAVAGEPFLVWQVTSSPTADTLPQAPDGRSVDEHADRAERAPSQAPSEPPTADSSRSAGPDPHALTLQMIRTPPDRPVEEVAERIAELAGQAFGERPVRIAVDPGSAQPLVSAATDPVATLAVQAEAELGGGPVSGTSTGSTVVVADLGRDGRFARSGPEISRRLGVTSVLAAPLRRGESVIGSLAVYSDAPDAFDASHVWLADWVAGVASGVLEASVRYNAAATESLQLRAAMTSRAVIEQAKGILMARHRIDDAAAFALLRASSQTRNRRLRDVAAEVVDEASTPVAESAGG
jgi:hypothetical protein